MANVRRQIIFLVIAVMILPVSCFRAGSDYGNVFHSSSVPSRTLHLGHQAYAGTAFDILANKIKENIETRSQGRYKIQIYPGGAFGDDFMLTESVAAGTVDIAIVTASTVSNFARELEVQDLPFLFSSWEEVFKFLDSDFVNDFYAITDAADITTLAFMPRGFRHAANNIGPINFPSDFQGMKFRVLDNAVYIDTFSALGADPMPMAWSLVYNALQQGRVDGLENTSVTINEYRIYEVQKYLSKTGHFFAFASVIASPSMLKVLPSDDRELIRKAAFDAAMEMGAMQFDAEEKEIASLQLKGMQINEIPDIQLFVDRMSSVYDNFFKTHDRKFFDGIKAAVR